MAVKDKVKTAEDHTRRVRRICMGMPKCEEKLSHGESTWFVRKRVFVMFANNHHNDGHVAVWLPTLPGMQGSLIAALPEIFFRPPYVGSKGWVGIELDKVAEEVLSAHILEAWRMVAPKSLVK
jgi:hypothetical protein